ncbi:MAG: cation:proton antiporter [Spirochaetia bacterium]|nr:cation:proton antiporter [Spirochaetia bacterium]
MHSLIYDIGLSVIVATVIGVITHRLKQPSILGYLIAGVVIGPEIGPQLVHDPANIEIISEIGLVLLLFIIGLEMNPQHLISGGKSILFGGLGQFPLSVLLGMGVFLIMGFSGSSHLGSLYLAIACGLSSTAIVVKALSDRFAMDSINGRLTVGILIFQDLWAILVLALQPGFENPQVFPVFMAIFKSTALLAFGYFFSKYILKRVFRWLTRAPEMVVAVSIGWCAIVAGAAHEIGLSFEMGALVAGVSLSSFPYSEHVTEKVLPLRDFFLTLFFISLGMKIPFPNRELLAPVLVIVLFVLASRFLVIVPLLRLGGSAKRSAFLTALNLSQISEFSLVIVSLGVSAGHVGSDILAIVLYSLAITSIASSYLLKYNSDIYRFAYERAGKFLHLLEIVPEEEQSHRADIIVLGFHRGARAFVDHLNSLRPELMQKVLIVDYSAEVLQAIKATMPVHILFGDISSADTLERAHASEAKFIVSTIPDLLLRGTTNLKIVKTIRGLCAEGTIIATAESKSHVDALKAAGANQVLLPYGLAGETLAEIIADSPWN